MKDQGQHASTKAQSSEDVPELQEFDNRVHRDLSPAARRFEDWLERWEQEDTTSQEVPVSSPSSSSWARESVAGSATRVANTLPGSPVKENNLPGSSVSELDPKEGKCCF